MVSKITIDTIVLGILFAGAVLIAAYFYPSVVENPFIPVVLGVFYIVLIVTHYTMRTTKS